MPRRPVIQGNLCPTVFPYILPRVIVSFGLTPPHDNVVENMWKALVGRSQRATVYKETCRRYNTEVTGVLEERVTQVLINTVKEEKHKTYTWGSTNIFERKRFYTAQWTTQKIWFFPNFSTWEKEDVATNICLCGTTQLTSDPHLKRMVKYSRNNGMRWRRGYRNWTCDTEEVCRLKCTEKPIDIVKDRWRPQTAKQDRGKMTCCRKHTQEIQMLKESLPGQGTARVPSGKECVVNSLIIMASNNWVRSVPLVVLRLYPGVDAGWQRRCKIRLVLREPDKQRTGVFSGWYAPPSMLLLGLAHFPIFRLAMNWRITKSRILWSSGRQLSSWKQQLCRFACSTRLSAPSRAVSTLYPHKLDQPNNTCCFRQSELRTSYFARHCEP